MVSRVHGVILEGKLEAETGLLYGRTDTYDIVCEGRGGGGGTKRKFINIFLLFFAPLAAAL